MKIPDNLKIGAHTYKVNEVLFFHDDSNELGQCDQEKLLIEIKSTLPEDIKEKVLFHEIIHAINWDFDEEKVEFLAHSLYQVFKENNLLK